MKILIADDEALARERLARLLLEVDDDVSIIEAEHGIDALEQIDRQAPDLVFLDIRMPGIDGIGVARHLNGLELSPSIIFTTAYQDYALDAFDVDAIDYLVKPIGKEKLRQSLHKARALFKAGIGGSAKGDSTDRRSHLSASLQGELKIIAVDRIYFFQASQKYVMAIWPEGELLLDDSLKSLEQEFATQFIRIHRHTLVAHRYITGLVKDDKGSCHIKLQDMEEKLLVSRRHVGDVRKTMKHL